MPTQPTREPIEPEYCDQVGCIRKVYRPYLYCDEHQDRASAPQPTAQAGEACKRCGGTGTTTVFTTGVRPVVSNSSPNIVTGKVPAPPQACPTCGSELVNLPKIHRDKASGEITSICNDPWHNYSAPPTPSAGDALEQGINDMKEICFVCEHELKVVPSDYMLRTLYCDFAACERWGVIVLFGVKTNE